MKTYTCDKCGKSSQDDKVIIEYNFDIFDTSSDFQEEFVLDLCPNCLQSIIRDIKRPYPRIEGE